MASGPHGDVHTTHSCLSVLHLRLSKASPYCALTADAALSLGPFGPFTVHVTQIRAACRILFFACGALLVLYLSMDLRVNQYREGRHLRAPPRAKP